METYEDVVNTCNDIEELRRLAIEANRCARAYEKALERLNPETRAQVLASVFNYLRVDIITGMPESELKDFLRDLEMKRQREKLGDDFAEG